MTHSNQNGAARAFVAYLPIAELRLNPHNARIHPARQIAQLKKSITAFGFTAPVLIDHQGLVIAGHGRIEAAKALGWTEVPTISLAHLTPAQVKAYSIADNKLQQNSTWDRGLLAQQLQELSLSGLDFSLDTLGFDLAEVDVLIQEAGNAKVIADDPMPDERGAPAITREGDVWLLGEHRILCADALEPASYARLMRGARAQTVFTDPPFNVRILGNVGGKGRIQPREFVMASGEMSREEFTEFLRKAATLMVANCQDGAVNFIVMDWRHLSELMDACSGVYSSLLNVCVWAKNNGGMGSLYRSAHELVFVFKVGKAPHRNNVQLGKHGRHRTNVWSYPGANSFSKSSEEGNLLALHPTPKPVALVADALLDCSDRGGLVLDPFLGSGTTVIAAERTGRICYGMDLDPLYVDTCVRRWQALTRHRAVHEASGRLFDEMPDVRERAETMEVQETGHD